MNNVILMGRLTRDPRQSMANTHNGELEVSKFTLAVDRRGKKDDGQKADFISCVAFKKVAEVINKYCKQGSKICINGRLQTGSYTDGKGNTVYTTDVIIENMEFAESKTQSTGSDSGFDSVDDEGLPFD